VIKPIKEALEPYKVHEGTVEKGVPHLHEPLGKLSIFNHFLFIDCQVHIDDPLCQNEDLKDKPINGAGHHVRAKTNTPIIGILTQPVLSSVLGHSLMWEN
jgi:hypothetical protein